MTERERELFLLCERLIQGIEETHERMEFWRERYKSAAKSYVSIGGKYEALCEVNANLRVELQAADYVVGEAMDAALEGERA
jgi:hypothetical protein